MKDFLNTTVLVIDDEELVRNDIEEILSPKKTDLEMDSVGLAASILFDTPVLASSKKKPGNIPHFKVHKASNGIEGLEMVKKSVTNGTPYAVIFLDMRMPGWDGIETAERIRKIDTKAEIIFVTAFSDNSIDDIVARAGQNVGFHCKPYASEEITQLATKAVTDYNKLRNLELLIETISSITINESHLNSLLRNIFDQLVTYVETDMALMGKLQDNSEYEKLFSIGSVDEKINLQELIARVREAQIADGTVEQLRDVVVARLNNYSIFAVLKDHERLKTEKLYLLKLFVLNAAKAINNAELQEKLLQKEKLSAVGNAVSMMMHDLRSPIKNIKSITAMMRQELPESEWLDMIDECGVQASEILEDFLDFIKETPVKKMPVNLVKVIEEGLKLSEPRNSDGQVMIKTSIQNDITIEGDESKLKRCIMNLVNNAIDALIDQKVKEPFVGISTQLNESAKEVQIIVSDNGPGIPNEIFKTVFDPFVTRKKTNGTGLGLAIVKQYIVAHGGDIKVENNKGAVFTVSLPL
jgi:signal transduction histidine kinase/CheY-like chemotaxis protein